MYVFLLLFTSIDKLQKLFHVLFNILLFLGLYFLSAPLNLTFIKLVRIIAINITGLSKFIVK